MHELFYDIMDIMFVIISILIPMIIGLLIMLGYYVLAKSSHLLAIGVVIFLGLSTNYLRR